MEVNDADVSLWSLQESGRSERHIKQLSDGDDDDDDVSFSDPFKISPDQIYVYVSSEAERKPSCEQ